MTVIDTSGVGDDLLGVGVAAKVAALFEREGELAAPDLLVLEVLAMLRREVLRGEVAAAPARGAVGDLEDVPLVHLQA